MRVEESVHIGCSQGDVWSVVVDPTNDPGWCHKVRAVEPVGDRRWKVTHRPIRIRPATELYVEQLHVERPSHLAMRERDEASTFDIEYWLEPTSTGTRFTQVSVFEWHGLPRLLQRLLGFGVRRDVRGQLRELKDVLERNGCGPGHAS